jgi:hypothetical protein
MSRQVFGCNIEGACGEGLLNSNIDAADPEPIHPHMGHEVAAFIRHGDIHRLPHRERFFLCRRNHSACII